MQNEGYRLAVFAEVYGWMKSWLPPLAGDGQQDAPCEALLSRHAYHCCACRGGLADLQVTTAGGPTAQTALQS